MEKFTKEKARLRFLEYLEPHRRKRILDFMELKRNGFPPAADFLINLSPHLRPMNPLNDLAVKVVNCASEKKVARYAEKGICLLVLEPSDDDREKITEKFLKTQEEFLTSEGRKKFKRRVRERIVGEISSQIKRERWFPSLQKTIKTLIDFS